MRKSNGGAPHFLRRKLRALALAATLAVLVAPGASGYAILFEDDFSDYDYFSNPFIDVVEQYPNAVTFSAAGGVGLGIGPLISLPALDESGILVLSLLSIDVEGKALVFYSDAVGNYIHAEEVLPSLFVGDNVGAFANSIPAGAEKMRLVLRLTDGNSATYDHVEIRAVPEPEAIALMGLGLLFLLVAGRRP